MFALVYAGAVAAWAAPKYVIAPLLLIVWAYIWPSKLTVRVSDLVISVRITSCLTLAYFSIYVSYLSIDMQLPPVLVINDSCAFEGHPAVLDSTRLQNSWASSAYVTTCYWNCAGVKSSWKANYSELVAIICEGWLVSKFPLSCITWLTVFVTLFISSILRSWWNFNW